MEEKANIMQQFEALAREKQKVADEGKPFAIEHEQIRRQIEEFSEKRKALKVRASLVRTFVVSDVDYLCRIGCRLPLRSACRQTTPSSTTRPERTRNERSSRLPRRLRMMCRLNLR